MTSAVTRSPDGGGNAPRAVSAPSRRGARLGRDAAFARRGHVCRPGSPDAQRVDRTLARRRWRPRSASRRCATTAMAYAVSRIGSGECRCSRCGRSISRSSMRACSRRVAVTAVGWREDWSATSTSRCGGRSPMRTASVSCRATLPHSSSRHLRRVLELSTWTAEDVRDFLEAVADRLMPAYRLLASTGMRRARRWASAGPTSTSSGAGSP